jgi:hypothetical protein
MIKILVHGEENHTGRSKSIRYAPLSISDECKTKHIETACEIFFSHNKDCRINSVEVDYGD